MSGMSDRAEAINVMRDGARQLCDHAVGKWLGNAYGDDEPMRRENLDRWSAIRSAVSDLVAEMRQREKERATNG